MEENDKTFNIPGAGDFTCMAISMFNILNWKKATEHILKVGGKFVSECLDCPECFMTDEPCLPSCQLCQSRSENIDEVSPPSAPLPGNASKNGGSWVFLPDDAVGNTATNSKPIVGGVRPCPSKQVKFATKVADTGTFSQKVPLSTNKMPRPILKVRYKDPNEAAEKVTDETKKPPTKSVTRTKRAVTRKYSDMDVSSPLVSHRPKRQRRDE